MFNDDYQRKLITVDQALGMINSEDNIVSALGACEAQYILSKLHNISDRVRNVNVTTCLPMGKYEYFMNEENKGRIHMDGWFYSSDMRKVHDKGLISFVPNHLHLAGTKRLSHRKPNIFIGSATPMDKHGYLSLSLSATYEGDMIKNADKVIIEINPSLPRTFGDTTIHISEVDHVLEVDLPIPALPVQDLTEKDLVIGQHIAQLVEDGSTIQLGIGGIPNAAAAALKGKKDLGIHTEMFTDGMVDLVLSGVVTGKCKTLYPGKMVATFALGSSKLYDFLDDNPSILIMNGKWVNDPYVIGQNDNMVSINTTLEVDLTGQCCSESIGHRQFSGTGGQADTAIGAQISKGGKSIIALYSTANVRVNGQQQRVRISKISPRLSHGAAVTLSRNDVDFVVTEYGVAELRGTSIKERVERLVSIAHPDFRDVLMTEAKELGLM